MLTIVETPFAGDITANVKYARAACRDATMRGETPFASHLFYPQFLDENNPEERSAGIAHGFEFWKMAEKVVFYIDNGFSPGMKDALAKAVMEGRPYEIRNLYQQRQVPVDLDKLQADMKGPTPTVAPEVQAFAPKPGPKIPTGG